MSPRHRVAGARPVDRSATAPLWQQVLGDLTRRMATGEFTDAFPGELSLVEQYDVSRHTVREALRRLRSERLVTSERGRTSRLAGPAEIEQPVGTLYSLFGSVRATGQTQHNVVRRQELLADGVIAARLGREESTPLVYLERLRYAGDAPLALDRVWLVASLAQGLLEADFTATGLYQELHERSGARLTGGGENIRAVLATASERRLLELPADAAALAIDRIGRIGDEAVEWRHTLVRGDRFALTAEFSGRSGYSVDVSLPPGEAPSPG